MNSLFDALRSADQRLVEQLMDMIKTKVSLEEVSRLVGYDITLLTERATVSDAKGVTYTGEPGEQPAASGQEGENRCRSSSVQGVERSRHPAVAIDEAIVMASLYDKLL